MWVIHLFLTRKSHAIPSVTKESKNNLQVLVIYNFIKVKVTIYNNTNAKSFHSKYVICFWQKEVMQYVFQKKW